jgi:hypothetical protein
MDFSLCTENNIYRNINLLKSLWNYRSNVWSFTENGVQTRELCPFYFGVACCPEMILGRAVFDDSGTTACRDLRLSWFLICWNHNFMGLLNIQKYSVFPLCNHAEFWWDRWHLAQFTRRRWWSWSFFYLLDHHVTLPSWRRGERDKAFSLATLQFPCRESFYLACKIVKHIFYP